MAERTTESEKQDGGGHGRAEPKSLRELRKDHIERILAITGGHVEEAAGIFQIRSTELRRWMKKLEIK